MFFPLLTTQSHFGDDWRIKRGACYASVQRTQSPSSINQLWLAFHGRSLGQLFRSSRLSVFSPTSPDPDRECRSLESPWYPRRIFLFQTFPFVSHFVFSAMRPPSPHMDALCLELTWEKSYIFDYSNEPEHHLARRNISVMVQQYIIDDSEQCRYISKEGEEHNAPSNLWKNRLALLFSPHHLSHFSTLPSVLLGPPFAPHSLPAAAPGVDPCTSPCRLRAARCPRVPYRSVGCAAPALQRGHYQ